MKPTQRLLERIKERYRKAGPLLQVREKDGTYVWSQPGTEGCEEALCLEFVTTSGKFALLEGSGLWNGTGRLSDEYLDYLFEEEVAPYPVFSPEESWQAVSWVIARKENYQWKSYTN